jgi:hypothetical protein
MKLKRYSELKKLFFFMETIMPKAMIEIVEILNNKNIDFCFIGGSILPKYGYNRTTNDIDILISRKDRLKFETLVGTYIKRAFSGATKKFIWNSTKTKIDIIYSGEFAGSTTNIEFFEPKKISSIKNGLPILKLNYLIFYKLVSGIYGKRLKDFGDIQELIKINNLPEDYANNFKNDLKKKYIEIWNNTNFNDTNWNEE